MEKKITKREMFTKVLDVVQDYTDLVDFIQHEIDLLDKKSANRKPSKASEENVALKEVIVTSLATCGKPVTVTEMQKTVSEVADYSNQKISALLRQLVDEGKVVKTVDKKKSYFTVA